MVNCGMPSNKVWNDDVDIWGKLCIRGCDLLAKFRPVTDSRAELLVAVVTCPVPAIV